MEPISNSSSESIPQIYYCPITQELMVDPVIDKDGNSYERAAIEDWLSRSNISPLTRLPMSVHDLRPNRALKELIDATRTKHGLVTPTFVSNLSSAEISTALDINVLTNQQHALISLKPWDVLKRSPCDICCVVDVSASMANPATLKDMSTGTSESYGLTVLDIVKHAVKTIIHSLEPYDRLSIVSFESQAKTVSGLLEMNEKGKEQSLKDLETLEAEGQTNLWDGLYHGLEVLRRGSLDSPGTRNTAIFLLTDGEPNIIPPRGHVQMLQRYYAQNKGFTCIVNTFGFGYSLDSELLNELAVEGSSMVGTVFVNSLSNLMTTMALNAVLVVEPLNGAVITPHQGNTFKNAKVQSNSNQMTINIGSLFHGQSRDFLFQIANVQENVPYLKASVRHSLPAVEHPILIDFEGTVCTQDSRLIMMNLFRLRFVEVVKKLIGQMKRGQEAEVRQNVMQLIDDISHCGIKDESLLDLLKDIEGQTMEAIGIAEYYQKWGKHYLPSLLHAHMNQICNNFKDPGVQHYGGSMFKQIRDLVDENFCKLPAPKPTLIRKAVPKGSSASQSASSHSYSSTSSSYRAPSMSAYNNRDYGG